MTETFKASNGWYIDESGELNAGADGFFADRDEVEGAERFFQEKRDAELGRWRDKERPEFVCYEVATNGDERLVRVVDETVGYAYLHFEGSEELAAVEVSSIDVARRYFRLHPQHKPLPTEPGLYTHLGMFATSPHLARIVTCFGEIWEFEDNQGSDATATAQTWHDAGELVRLAPVEGGTQ